MSNLDRLATIHKTEKNRYHFYKQHYQKHFKAYKYKKINLLEIGVGGYENLLSGGRIITHVEIFFSFCENFLIRYF